MNVVGEDAIMVGKWLDHPYIMPNESGYTAD